MFLLQFANAAALTAIAPPGDLNADGTVDSLDTAILFGNWGLWGEGDLNRDAIVDAADAGILFEHWTGDRMLARPTVAPPDSGFTSSANKYVSFPS